MRCGYEMWLWGVVMRCGYEVWLWDVVMRCGYEMWLWDVVMRCGQGRLREARRQGFREKVSLNKSKAHMSVQTYFATSCAHQRSLEFWHSDMFLFLHSSRMISLAHVWQMLDIILGDLLHMVWQLLICSIASFSLYSKRDSLGNQWENIFGGTKLALRQGNR